MIEFLHGKVEHKIHFKNQYDDISFINFRNQTAVLPGIPSHIDREKNKNASNRVDRSQSCKLEKPQAKVRPPIFI